MQITERSPKAEIISHACEMVDSQADRIRTLEQQQLILWALVALMASALLVL